MKGILIVLIFCFANCEVNHKRSNKSLNKATDQSQVSLGKSFFYSLSVIDSFYLNSQLGKVNQPIIKLQTNKIYLDSICFQKFNSQIEVYSRFVIDSVYYPERNEYIDERFFFSQLVVISIKDKIIYRKEHKVNKYLESYSKHFKNTLFLDCRIVDVGILSGINELFFVINGWGGCSWCPMFTQIIDSKGKVFYLLYDDKSYRYKEIKCDLKTKFKSSGISFEKYLEGKYDLLRF